MIYLLDKHEKLLTIITEDDLTEFVYQVENNRFDQAYFEATQGYTVSKWGNVAYFGFFYKNTFKIFRVIENISSEMRFIRGVDRAESDLRTIGIIKDKRPQNVTASQALVTALENTGYQIGEVVDLPEVRSTNFYYISPHEALTKIIDIWQCEFRVRYTFVENRVTGRFIDLYKKQGKVSGKQFVYGDDLLSVEYEEESDNVITALIGRGKGEELDSGGYGRRIEFDNVSWSKSSGSPVDKPVGQNYVVDDEARQRYGLSQDGQLKHRWGVFVDDQIEDPTILLQRTYEELKKLSVPLSVFRTSVLAIGDDVWIGDSVAIIHDDINIAFEARVQKMVIDMLAYDQTDIILGDYQTLASRQQLVQSNNIQRQIDSQMSGYARDLQAFYERLEAEKRTRNEEIDEKFRLAEIELNNAKELAELKAQQFKSELESKIDSEIKPLANGAKQDADRANQSIANQIEEMERLRTNLSNEAQQALAEAENRMRSNLESVSRRTRTVEDNLSGLTTRFENIRVGGRNLIKDYSMSSYDWKSQPTDKWSIEVLDDIERFSGKKIRITCLSKDGIGSSTGVFFNAGNPTQKYIGQEMTHSIYVRSNRPLNIYTGYFGGAWHSVNTSTEWMRDIFSFTSSKTSDPHFRVYLYNDFEVGDWIEIADFQLELGNIATTPKKSEELLNLELATYKQTVDRNFAELTRTTQTVSDRATEYKSAFDQTAERFRTSLNALEVFKNNEGVRAQAYFNASREETARQIREERTAISENYIAKSRYEADARGIRERFEGLSVGSNLIRNSKINQSSNLYGFGTRTVQIEAGKTYWFLANAKKTGGSPDKKTAIFIYDRTWSKINKNLVFETNSYTTKSLKFVSNFTGEVNISSYWFPDGGDRSGTSDVNWYMLVEGDIKPSDWQPHPEDTETRLVTFERGLQGIEGKFTTLNNEVMKTNSFTINENGIVLQSGRTFDGRTIASLLTVNDDNIKAITDRMIITPNNENLVKSDLRNIFISERRDAYATDFYYFDLAENDEFLFEGMVSKERANGNFDLNMLVEITFEDTTKTWEKAVFALKNTVNTTQRQIFGTLKIPRLPKKVRQFRLGFQQPSYSNFTRYRVENLKIYKKTSASLIVDGSITGRHIKANSIETGHHKAGSVTTEILGANAVTAEKMLVNQAMINKLMTDDLLANKIIASSAFITKLDTIEFSANRVTSGILASRNGAISWDLDKNNLILNQTAKIQFNSFYNQLVIENKGDFNGLPTSGGVAVTKTKNTENVSVVFGTSSGRTFDINDVSFTGLRIHQTDYHCGLYGSTIDISDTFDSDGHTAWTNAIYVSKDRESITISSRNFSQLSENSRCTLQITPNGITVHKNGQTRTLI